MKKKLAAILLLSFLLIVSSACKKSDLLNKYARYMSCKIDGQSWTPRFTVNLETDPVFAATGTTGYYGELYLEVIGTRYYKVNGALRKKYIRLYIHPIPRTLQFPYTFQLESFNRPITYHNSETGQQYFGGDNPNDRGQITITTYDTAQQVFRGSFSCTLVNGRGEVIRITEGRFDSK